MLIQDEPMPYDRVFISNLRKSGFQIIDDLVPLYHMISYFNKYVSLSKSAKQRLNWFDFYQKRQNASLTCRRFGISRKTFHKWLKLYDPNNLFSLEDRSRAPLHTRQPEISPEQEQRIILLRKQHICYSKFKLSKIYQRLYQEPISSWKVQRVIQKYHLYHNPQRAAKITKKRLSAQKKKRITELKRRPKAGFLLCLDAIEFRWVGLRRFVFTAIDHFSKVAFARMYKSANSYNAADFLNRLLYLLNGHIENIQTDNGSEFEKCFTHACAKLKLARYYNRPRTPKDNPVNERFNQTLENEFVNLGNFTVDTVSFNQNLAEWLIEYNFQRPHETLNYETPMKFNNSTKVLPMCPSRTPSP